MAHPLQDKLVVFIGTPRRCTRQAARDALTAIGGIPDESITAFTNYVVACERADGTKKYKKALEYDRSGLLSVLTEDQFFDILENKAAPPEKPEYSNDVIVIPCADPEAAARESEQTMAAILNRKRMNNLARNGVPTPDGRVKVDLRPLEKITGAMRIMKEQESQDK